MDKLYLLLCFYLPDESYDWSDPNLEVLVKLNYLRRKEDTFELTAKGRYVIEFVQRQLAEDLR